MNYDYYKLLGIEENATQEEIKKSYRLCSIKYHPDNNECNNSNTIFILIKEAYDVLSDPDKRKSYDIKRSHQNTDNFTTSEDNQTNTNDDFRYREKIFKHREDQFRRKEKEFMEKEEEFSKLKDQYFSFMDELGLNKNSKSVSNNSFLTKIDKLFFYIKIVLISFLKIICLPVAAVLYLIGLVFSLLSSIAVPALIIGFCFFFITSIFNFINHGNIEGLFLSIILSIIISAFYLFFGTFPDLLKIYAKDMFEFIFVKKISKY